MTVLNETIDVARPIDEAFDYVSDFTTTTEWDSTVLRATKLTPGAIKIGTEFDVVCALPVGSVDIKYKIIAMKTDDSIELLGSCKYFLVRDKIQFSRSKRGTRIQYGASFEFKPLVKPIASLSKKGMEKMGRDSVAGLATALEDNYPLEAQSNSKRRAGDSAVSGLPLFSRLGYQLGRKRFNPMTTSVKGKHMVLTGATAGLGYTLAKEFARRGVDLTLVARDRKKVEKVVADLKRETGNDQIGYELADLSLLEQVDNVISRLLKAGKPIDVLINNAGALFNERELTTEGLERSAALLLLSPYRLTEGLKPLLAKAPAARVINVVSGGMYSQKLDVDLLLGEDGGKYSGSATYARQKRALMVMTEEWARKWLEEGIVVNAMHPGWADTPGVRSALPTFRRLTKRVLRSPQEGADTVVWLAVAKEAGTVSGKLFLDRAERTTHFFKSTVEAPKERYRLSEFLKSYSY
ncbi:MAG: dehydrogenase/reductase SDR family protein 12 [Halioglobus sp.]|jgi:dehydrogenase/reductase SDR family protein 12